MEVWLYIIRLGVLLSLYAFLTIAFWLIWRELATVTETRSGKELPATARLLVIEPGETGLESGESLPIDGNVSLGRALGNSYVLVDSSVSARHALLSFREGHWWLEDRDSTNGTTLNGGPVRGRVPIRHEDTIGLGLVRLKLVQHE